MKAFIVALAMFVLTVTGCHIYSKEKVAVNNPAYSMWTAENKSISYAALTSNMNAGTMPVFGSSEFQHGTDTIYHPAEIFKGNRFNPMLIGAGYYQSLSHAVTLAAIEPYMQQRKAVLILSPQWFRKTGVVNQAYASRFSEPLYMAMLQNEKLSEESREYIAKRTELLLEVDETTRNHVQRHNQVLWKKTESVLEKGQEKIWNIFLKEKDKFSAAAMQTAAGIERNIPLTEEDCVPDWETLMQQAQIDGEVENTNSFYINDVPYKKLEPYLETKKDMNKDAIKGYQNSPEYDDLRCFLRVCRELEIEPMLVLVPVNGYYYDYTGFPSVARQGYYQNIRDLASEFDAKVADFADQEYTKYFFEDRVHLGKKGWVMVSESIYNFYSEK